MTLLVPFLQQFWLPLQNITVLNSFLLCLLFFTSFCFLFNKALKQTKFNLPPSPPRLPIIGNLHQLGTLPHRSLQALSNKYGPIMLLNLGYTRAVVITSPDIAKEIIKSHDVVFSNRPKTTAIKHLNYDGEDIVFASYGDHWLQAKKICVQELLRVQRVQSFQSVREEEVEFMIKKIHGSCQNGSSSINLFEILTEVSNNIVSRCVLGKKYENEKDGRNKFGDMSRKISIELTLFSFGDYFPWLGWIDSLIGSISRMKATFKEWDSHFDQVLEQHKILKSTKNLDHQNFLDILLGIQNDGSDEFVLTDKKIKAILLDMIGAGTETTSTTMEWIMAELIKNPSKLKKAQEEVRRVVGTKKTLIDENDIYQMEYLKCVIKETLRLHSPATLLVSRETSMDVKLAGYDIPAKTTVLINSWAIQRDKQVWGDDAEKFIPERFESNPVDFRGQDFEFIPFGAGRRQCPGMSFGIATTEQVVANLLYWFDWELPEGLSVEDMDMSELYGLTTSKKVPPPLVATMYSP